jgi:predicted Fe-Mo cluster-binding NifX family protein
LRIAIATDQDFVSSHFGCSPACTIVDIEGDRIRETFIIPNPGCRHEYWGELFCRNSIKSVIAGNMGSHAKAVLRGCGIDLILGIEGRLEDVVRRFINGELRLEEEPADCGSGPDGPCRRTA